MDESYKQGYEQGVKDILQQVSNWLDEDTLMALEEQFGVEDKEDD